MHYPEPISKLIDSFMKLPGIGPKTAARLAFYVLTMKEDTVSTFAKALIDAGAKAVYAAATHAILSGNAIKNITEGPITEVVVTDTIELPKEKQIDKIKQISIGPLIGESIKHVMKDEPISQIFDRITHKQ